MAFYIKGAYAKDSMTYWLNQTGLWTLDRDSRKVMRRQAADEQMRIIGHRNRLADPEDRVIPTLIQE